MPQTPIISDDEILRIGEEYQILINPNDATQYKLCQIIQMLEQEIDHLKAAE